MDLITFNDVKSIENDILKHWRNLHRLAELSFKEFQTAKYIEKQLKQYTYCE